MVRRAFTTEQLNSPPVVLLLEETPSLGMVTSRKITINLILDQIDGLAPAKPGSFFENHLVRIKKLKKTTPVKKSGFIEKQSSFIHPSQYSAAVKSTKAEL